MATITWDSVPNYDEWGFDDSWGCNDWIEYHKQLKKKFGKEKAKYVWEYAFAQGSMGASHYDCRSFNTSFRKYVDSQGLDPYQSVGALSIILKPIGATTDIVSGVSDAISMIGRYTKPILIVGLIGIASFYGYKAFKTIKQ